MRWCSVKATEAGCLWLSLRRILLAADLHDMDGWMEKLNHGCRETKAQRYVAGFSFECKGSLILLSQSSPSPSLVRRTRNWTLEAQYLPRHQLYVRTDDTKKVRLLRRGWSFLASDSPFPIHVVCGRPMAAVFKSGPKDMFIV